MKIVASILLTALLSFIACIYFPWWSIAVVAFLVAVLMRQSIVRSFLSGFLSIFLLWSILALWIDVKNNSILSQRIAQLFAVGSPFLLILVTAFIGALVGGFAAMSGSSLLMKNRNRL
jgi:hypothetical protein